MKIIDFSQPGGFPLTEDDLAYMQTGYTEVLQALVAMGNPGGGVPFVITGMAVSGGGNTVANGWFYYNGDIIQFTGGTVAPGAGEVALAVITVVSNPLTFNDGSMPDVVNNKTAALGHAATVTDALHFPISALVPFGVGFGANNREAVFNTINVATASGVGGVTGVIYYKKDFTANTVHVKGTLLANDAQNFTGTPNYNVYNMGNLPAGWRAGAFMPFVAWANDASGNRIKDDASFAYIDTINGYTDASGAIILEWVKPAAAVSVYGVSFNFIFSCN